MPFSASGSQRGERELGATEFNQNPFRVRCCRFHGELSEALAPRRPILHKKKSSRPWQTAAGTGIIVR
jgi:hypothetical protein